MKRWKISWLVLSVISMSEAAKAYPELDYDGFDNIATMERQVRDAIEVQRSPLFDNAPFLRLHPGDKLVKARMVKSKGKPLRNLDEFNIYLFSGGKHYELRTSEEGDKLLLSGGYSAHCCLLFDWDLTINNAKALRGLLLDQYSKPLTKDQYNAAIRAIQGAFPDIPISSQAMQLAVREDRLIAIPGQALAQLQGLGYDRSENILFLYTIKIGPEVFTITGERLIDGPKRVERWEFEHPQDFVQQPNSTPPEPIDPKTAARKKLEYEQMKKFEELVTAAIESKAVK